MSDDQRPGSGGSDGDQSGGGQGGADGGAALPAAGWYPDPADPGRLRWWDGAAWTSSQSPGGTGVAATSGTAGARQGDASPAGDVTPEAELGSQAGPAAAPTETLHPAAAPTETLHPAAGGPAAGVPAAGVPAPGVQAGGGPAAPRNTQALLALIAGIVGIFLNPLLLVGIAAIVLGVLGLRRARRERIEGRGKALTGIILGAVATVLWIVLTVVFVITLTSLQTQTGSPGASPSVPSAAPPTDESEPPAEGELACWDGTQTDGSCPALAGPEALTWVFSVDAVQPAECEAVTEEFEPAGAEEILLCTWEDLPGSEVYLARYPEPAAETQDAWRGYMAAYEEFTESELLDQNGDPLLQLEGTDSGDIAATEFVLSYAEAPFVMDVWTDLTTATAEQHSEALARVQFRDVAGLVEAQQAAG